MLGDGIVVTTLICTGNYGVENIVIKICLKPVTRLKMGDVIIMTILKRMKVGMQWK